MTIRTRNFQRRGSGRQAFGIWHVLMIGMMLGLTGCENFALPHQAWTVARVEGRVVDERTHEPIADATVSRVRRPELGDAYASDKGAKQLQYRPTIATTGTDGRFTLVGERTASLFLQTFPDYAVAIRFQRQGYETIERLYTNAVLGTPQDPREPVINTGDVPMVRR